MGEETGQASDKTEYDIHFWLGKKTSTDEKGTAAYKTVELDDFFDGAAVQHREVQGSESQAFISYFKDGLEYLPGGVESGFNVTQQDIFVSTLIQVRRQGGRNIFEEEAVTLASLNHRDAFILTRGRAIYVFFGDNCSPFIKNAANLHAENLESRSNGELTVMQEIDDEFWNALGGQGPITPADEVGEEVEPNFGEGVLYEVQVDESRQLSITEVARGDLKREHLNPSGIMMVDTRT